MLSQIVVVSNFVLRLASLTPCSELINNCLFWVSRPSFYLDGQLRANYLSTSLFCKSQLWFQIWYKVVVKLIYIWPFLQISLCSLKKSMWILWQRPFSLYCSQLLPVIWDAFCFYSPWSTFFYSGFLFHHILLSSLLSQYDCLLPDLGWGWGGCFCVVVWGFFFKWHLFYCGVCQIFYSVWQDACIL